MNTKNQAKLKEKEPKIVDFGLNVAEREGFEPSCAWAQTDFESSVKKRTWRNLTEDKGHSENPQNPDVFKVLAVIISENAVKIKV